MHYLLGSLAEESLGLLGSSRLLPQTLVRELSGDGGLLGHKVGGDVRGTEEDGQETNEVLEGVLVLEVGESVRRPHVVQIIVDTQGLLQVSSVLLVVVLLVGVLELCGEGVNVGVIAELG
jgi:hypothetical protein